MRRFGSARIFLLLLMSLSWTAARTLTGETEAAADPEFAGEIVIGATFPLSGALENYGQSAYYGANTRVRLINAAGGVNGKKLVLEWRDNRGDPAQATRDVEEFVEKYQVAAVLGPLLSEATMAVAPTARRLQVVVMTPLATIDAATRGNPWVFRACFNNSAMADGLVDFQIQKYGSATCAILYDPRFAVWDEMIRLFAQRFTRAGGTIVGGYGFVNADGTKDYATPLREMAAEKPDFIFAPCYALEATEIIHTARDLGIATRFCGTDAWDNELVFDASGSRLAGTAFASSLFERAFSYRPFQTFFTAMEQAGMDNPDAQAACAYDAVTLLATALENGEAADDVRKGLLDIKRLSLATGRTSISPEGDAVKPVIIRVVERNRGRLVPVYAERYDP